MRSHLKTRADWIEFLLGVYPATLLSSLTLPLAVWSLLNATSIGWVHKQFTGGRAAESVLSLEALRAVLWWAGPSLGTLALWLAFLWTPRQVSARRGWRRAIGAGLLLGLAEGVMRVWISLPMALDTENLGVLGSIHVGSYVIQLGPILVGGRYLWVLQRTGARPAGAPEPPATGAALASVPLVTAAASLVVALGFLAAARAESHQGAIFLRLFMGEPLLAGFSIFCLFTLGFGVWRLRSRGAPYALAPALVNALTVLLLFNHGLFLGERRYMSDRDVQVLDQQPSPDGKVVAVTFNFDIGALGYSERQTSLMPAGSLDASLLDYALPVEYKPAGWDTDGAFRVRYNLLAYAHRSEKWSERTEEWHGVHVRAIPEDYLESATPVIVRRIPSPDGARDLVVYKYTKSSRPVFIHLSVVKRGDPPPRYGNVYMGDYLADYIFDAEWAGPERLRVFTNSFRASSVPGLFVGGRPLQYEVVVDDERFKKLDRWPG